MDSLRRSRDVSEDGAGIFWDTNDQETLIGKVHERHSEQFGSGAAQFRRILWGVDGLRFNVGSYFSN